MMLLSDRDLRAAIADGRLTIDPYEPELVQPSSIDVRLDRHLLAWAGDRLIDPAREPEMTPWEIPDGQTYPLLPGVMVLVSTVERITIDRSIAARVEGKSSLARLGLAAHITAGFIDPGFSGHITLELVNHAPRPILLYPGMRIGQLCVIPMSSPAEQPYGSASVGSHYQGQRGPTPSRSWQNWRTWPTTAHGGCDQCGGKGWVRVLGNVYAASTGYETAAECMACNADGRIPYAGQLDFYDKQPHHLAHQTPPGVFDPNCPACKEAAA